MAFYDYSQYKYFEHSAGTTKSALSRKIWSKILHEKTRNKIFFTDWIGQEQGGEGVITSTKTFPPIIEKTDFTKEPGDTIIMGILKHMNVDAKTSGVVGDEVLLGREKSFDFGKQSVFVDVFREAVGVRLGLNTRRTPYDLITLSINQLSDFAAIITDDEIFNTYYAGWNYTLLRGLANKVFLTDTDGYITNIFPTHLNTFWGGIGKTDPNELTTDDGMSARLIEQISVWAEINNIIPVSVEGTPTWILVIHPFQEKQLLRDPEFREALIHAKQRAVGWEHPLFKRANYWYSNIAIYVSNKIRTAKYYGLKTIGSNKYGLRVQTVTYNGYNYTILNDSNATVPTQTGSTLEPGELPDGITADHVYGALLIGGNSLMIARASDWTSERRKEDDYGAFFGFALQTIWGMKRNDWNDTIDLTGGSFFNESSAIIYTYTPPMF